MSSLFAGLENETRRSSRRCAVAVLGDRLDPEDRTAFLEVMKNTDVPVAAIRDRLVGAGYTIGKDSLWRHRRGDCKC